MSIDENIVSHIMQLAYKLRNFAEDILYYATYDASDTTSTESSYRKHIKNAVQFNAGAHVCERYLYGSIALEEFCIEMIDNDLKDYLIDMPNLPNDLVTKYDLYYNCTVDTASNVINEDVEMGWSEIPPSDVDVSSNAINENIEMVWPEISPNSFNENIEMGWTEISPQQPSRGYGWPYNYFQ